MKLIDLGYGAVALEPEGPADRVDAVPRELFERFELSEESVRLYERFQNNARSAGSSPGHRGSGTKAERK